MNPFAEEDVACSIAVIAARTGLGEANLIWDGGQYHIIAMEGEQADFAPKEVPTKAFLIYKCTTSGFFSEIAACQRTIYFLTVPPICLLHLPFSGNDRRMLPLSSYQLPPEQVKIRQSHQQVDL